MSKPDGTKNRSSRGAGREMPRKSSLINNRIIENQPWGMSTRADRAEHKRSVELARFFNTHGTGRTAVASAMAKIRMQKAMGTFFSTMATAPNGVSFRDWRLALKAKRIQHQRMGVPNNGR